MERITAAPISIIRTGLALIAAPLIAELRVRLPLHGRSAFARSSAAVAGVTRRSTFARSSAAVTGVTRRFANACTAASALRKCSRGGNEKGCNQQRKRCFGHLTLRFGDDGIAAVAPSSPKILKKLLTFP